MEEEEERVTWAVLAMAKVEQEEHQRAVAENQAMEVPPVQIME